MHTSTPITPIVPILSITTTGTIAPDVIETGQEEQKEGQIVRRGAMLAWRGMPVAEESLFAWLYLPLLLKGPSDATGTAQNEAPSAPIGDETVDIEQQKVQIMLSSARGKYESQRQQAESKLELSRLRATQTVQALGSPIPVETAVAQLLIAEEEHMQSCLFPTPDPMPP